MENAQTYYKNHGSMSAPNGHAAKLTMLDRIAALTLAGDAAFAEVRRTYESDERLQVPSMVFNALRNAPESIISGH